MADEIWKPIPGYPDYFASNEGRVASSKSRRLPTCGDLFVLRPFGQDGYARVHLSVRGRTRGRFVHRCVALAFHGEPADPSMVVAHCNGDRRDNRADNLRWATASENIADRHKHNLSSRRDPRRGNRAVPRAIKIAIVRELDRNLLSIKEIADKWGVSRKCVHNYLNNAEQYRISPSAQQTNLAAYEAALVEIEQITRNNYATSVILLRDHLTRVNDLARAALQPEVFDRLAAVA